MAARTTKDDGSEQEFDGVTPIDDQGPKADLRKEIERAINRHSAENGSNTPDFILAQFLQSSLEAFDRATKEREDWYGVRHRPGCGTSPTPEAAGGLPY